MQREFLQEKSLNRTSDNAEKSLNVDLSAKSRLIPFSTTAGMLSLNKLYTDERDECETYRMIFTVNPICTNVLYNAITEPVYKEGSEDAINLIETGIGRDNQDVFPDGTINESGETVDQVAAVRDTEYSHEKIGNFKYHCGYDIFNNHLLRGMDFQHIKRTKNIDNKNEFNTIFDYLVDYKGDVVERYIGDSEGPFNANRERREKLKLYQLDNIKPINLAFYDGLRQVDGWYGFYNSGNINIPNATLNGEDIEVNCVINNETRCEFIDLYPDRTLYSFIPKVNRFRKRIERNWDCTVVYPFENDYDKFNEVNGNNINAVKVLSTQIVYDNVGNEQILMQSLLRHTLNPGSQIRLFYKKGDNGLIKRYSIPITVITTGDETGENLNKYFKIKLYDIRTFCTTEDVENNTIHFFYKKIENGCDDRYYFRKFKEIINYRYVQTNCEGLTPTKLTKEPTVINENSPRIIKLGDECFKLEGEPIHYTQNKIAFGENIYGDRIAQVIFNDDICITGLKDNLGRPLTELYFMVLKTNRGHEKWYDEGNATDDKVEYSHCFGDITSGLDLPSGVTDYNVRCLHNVFFKDLPDESEYKDGLSIIMENAPSGDYGGNAPKPIENNLTLEYSYDHDLIMPHIFYGDVVEFNRAGFMEHTIEKVYHRFNTAQRECLKNQKYFDIHYDELVGDLYDVKPDNQN